jgi:phosphohistidine phosphatase
MRRLMLLRHGKSDSPSGVSDIDRPLAMRGKEAVPRIATHMAEEQLFPDLALVSPARRARESWDLLAPKLGEVPARSEPRIYEAPPERLLAVIRELGPGVRSVLLVGHNPGLEDFLELLTGAAETLKTSSIAVASTPATWAQAQPGAWTLKALATPRGR